MKSIRESLASIPSAVSNFISENTSSSSSLSSVASSSSRVDESSSGDKLLTIPASLIKEQWKLIINSDSTISNLEQAIATCKALVLDTEEASEERNWLVRHLIELRYELEQLKNAADDPNEYGPSTKTVIGHHFSVRKKGRRLQNVNVRTYCDHCTRMIWSMVQTSYICNDCKYIAHAKCVNDIIRVCAHVVVSEKKYPISVVCPEIGLAAQKYKCAECQTMLISDGSEAMQSWVLGSSKKFENKCAEPRICDYNGLYYCPICHWNDVSMIPARIIHNWDFIPRKVCRASLQEINLFFDKPIVKLEEANPKLFVFLQKLSSMKKLRKNLYLMKKYLLECRVAKEEKLMDNHLGTKQYLIQSSEYYSLRDLEQVESSELYEFLSKTFRTFYTHIRSCTLCSAKAYICEICGDGEIIFPFDDGCVGCDRCKSIYHRVCMTRKNSICPKCERFKERNLMQSRDVDETEDIDGINGESGD